MSTPITTEITYNATPEKIWKAITDVGQMKEWYFDMQGFKPEVGTVFSFYEPGENKKFLHQCEVKEVIPNRKFQHTWGYPDFSSGESVVTWNITPEGEQTKVVLTHEGIENFQDGGPDFERKNFEAGWKEILGDPLKKFVEGL